MSTEIDVGGIKIKGGRLFMVLTALATLIGSLYGAFEVYKTYQDMQEAIGTYEAPDLSGIEERISILEERIESQNTTLAAQESITSLSRESINRIDGDMQSLFSDVRASDKRLYELERDTSKELIEIRKSIRTQIEEALENPLSNTQ
jgi:DNA anti-recombination protein RmuC|tara:strand:- start:64 stop:504 length:441 start_codon:yes stop_codon:yes gene_type:complete